MYKIIFLIILLVALSTSSIANEYSQKAEIVTYEQVQWLQKPHLKNHDLFNFPTGNYELTVRINANSEGIIKSIYILKSSGLSQLDQYVTEQVHKAQFKPYTKNGIASDFNVEQPFVVIIPKIQEKSWWQKILWY